jgi:hypothetical protein
MTHVSLAIFAEECYPPGQRKRPSLAEGEAIARERDRARRLSRFYRAVVACSLFGIAWCQERKR